MASAGVEPLWLTRPLRSEEEAILPAHLSRPIFYRWTDGPRRRSGGRKLLKGIEHVLGLAKALGEARRFGPDVVHLQWSVIPLLDRLAVRWFRRRAPVVITVHDVTPFNGKDVSILQRHGFGEVLAAADRLIVHTAGARDELTARGLAASRIDVVPHGLLAPATAARGPRGSRWRIVQFGRIQHYKGVDLLIEAMGWLSPADRDRIEVIVAGEAQVDPAPLLAAAAAHGLGASLDLRFGYMSERAMADLLASADAFVFPYRTVEASGVLHLVAGLGRWIIASDVGAFPDLLGRDGAAGALIDPTDPDRLATALVASIGRVPTRMIAADVPDWAEIGRMTREVYEHARSDWGRS